MEITTKQNTEIKSHTVNTESDKNKIQDAKRIDRILEKIDSLWKDSPEIRFMQLIYILQNINSRRHQGYGKVEQKMDDFT